MKENLWVEMINTQKKVPTPYVYVHWVFVKPQLLVFFFVISLHIIFVFTIKKQLLFIKKIQKTWIPFIVQVLFILYGLQLQQSIS